MFKFIVMICLLFGGPTLFKLWSHRLCCVEACPTPLMQACKLGGTREVFGTDCTREVALIGLPASRVRLACKAREDSAQGL